MFAAFAALAPLPAQQRISEDRDLKEYDLSGWDCLNQLGGSAKTEDGTERNQGKNRAPVSVAGVNVPSFDTAGFLRHVGAFDAQTKGKRRKEITPPQREQMQALEKQIVTLTAYLVITYAGPPESTNCGNIDFHDWHLELFEKPLDHAPHVGDPTPIIAEVTPRTQNTLFKEGVRLQKLAGFFRRPDLESEQLPQKPQRVRITGYLLWDDDHNGAADIGPTIQRIAKNGYHQPWRATAWEIHPILKIEPAEGATLVPDPASVVPAAPAPAASPTAATTAPTTPTPPPDVTLVEPVKIKVRYGETVLPRGLKLPFVARDTSTVTVKYMGQNVYLPLHSTDVR